jgi:ribosomal protein S18 acetylase RimI-like enzyme
MNSTPGGPTSASANSVSVIDHGLASTAALLTEAFADYYVKLAFSPATLLGMARQDSVDLAASRVWLVDGRPAGVLLHASRGWSGRLAGMAVIPSARRSGLGARMVEAWMTASRQSGLHWLVLEVIGANEAAIRLYERCGFQRGQRLAGWSCRTNHTLAESGKPEPVDPRAMAALVAARDAGSRLPWQIAAETLAQIGPPSTAWQVGGAHALISDLSLKVVAVRGLTWEPAAGPAAAAKLLRCLMARNPNREWRAPAIFPESWSAVFTESGWQREAIDQWQMERNL